MTGTAPLPRDRALPLLLVVAVLALVGGFVEASRSLGGEAPAVCPRPALRGAELSCDGTGDAIGARAWLVGQRLDLNLASARDLARVPGIGQGLARAIVEERARRGAFAAVSELDDVRGIGPAKLRLLASYVEVEAGPYREATSAPRPVTTVP